MRTNMDDSIPDDLSGIIERIKNDIIPGIEGLESEDDQKADKLAGSMSALTKQLESKNREIRDVMIRDDMTMLYNRNHLATVLEDEIARSRRYGHPLAVLMIDIDGLSEINIRLGQKAGDHMIISTGNIIKENVRKFDRTFRYGGEEFVVVLPETDMTLAHIVSERIRKNFQAAIPGLMREICPGNTPATMSIGVTSTYAFSLEDVSTEELISQTEDALSRAKARGGNISILFRR